MIQDEIILMAREAGFVMNEAEAKLCHPTPKAASLKNMLERFAALVAAHEREKQPEYFTKAIAELVKCCRVLAEENEAAVLAEREACAKVCEGKSPYWESCAAAIRARTNKE